MKILCRQSFKMLEENYLFSQIEKEVRQYREAHSKAKIISLGIGDVTLPLSKTVVSAMKKAAEDMGEADGFHGYAPLGGYPFLRQAIAGQYQHRGCEISANEIFVTDGAKSALASLVSLFEAGRVLLPTPNYPAYADVARMNGFLVEELEGNPENEFLPLPISVKNEGYLIFLCSPQNPTGVTYSKSQLEEWVAFARETKSLILFDAAYEAFASDEYPHSIYGIPEAKECAIEIGSFSKSAGFTGVRCGWVVVPEALRDGNGDAVHRRWTRRVATTDNGVSYITQRGAEATFTPQGQSEVREQVNVYLKNASKIKSVLLEKGLSVYGGDTSPYLWFSWPNGGGSWDIFKYLLTFSQIVCTPGVGFGKAGEGYVRFSAFGKKEDVEEACGRLSLLSFS